MGARFLTAALLLSTAWYVWRWQAAGLSVEAAVARISVWSFLAAGVGKFVGIALSRKRVQAPARQ